MTINTTVRANFLVYIVILILPLLSALNLFLFGRFIGRYGAILFSVFNLLLSLGCSLYLFFLTYYYNEILSYTVGTWVEAVGPSLIT